MYTTHILTLTLELGLGFKPRGKLTVLSYFSLRDKRGPQLEEDENLNTEAPRTERTPLGGTSSLTSPSVEEVGEYSSDGSSRSRSRGRSWSAQKHRKSVSRKKGISKYHRSVRSEVRSRSKSKSVKWKPQSVRASRRKSSSDSWYHTMSDSGSEDLNVPYRQPKPMPFTYRITHFRYHRRAKLSPNVQQKRYDKDPTEIHGIKQKPNKGLQAFMDRFKSESAHIKGVPPVLRIFVFMHGHSHLELAKKLNDKIAKTINEMWNRVNAFIREGFTPLMKTLKKILVMDNVNFPLPSLMVGTPEKPNMNKFYDYHQDQGHNINDCCHLKKQIEEVVASGRLAHLVKDIRVRRIYVDGGISSEIMYEHCFRNLSYRTRSRLREYQNPLVGFSREVNYPLGVIDLEVTIRECRKGMRSLGAIASTIHSMIKFPTLNGIAIIATTKETLREYRQIKEAQALKQLVTIRGGLSVECKHTLIHTLRRNVDVFAWTPADMTGIPQATSDHNLDTY
nr:reverse transcriptase domain-containing protein [Tanacetum cinerariifolium]